MATKRAVLQVKRYLGRLRSWRRGATSHLLPSAGYQRGTPLAVNRWHGSPVGLSSVTWVLDRAAPFAQRYRRRVSVLRAISLIRRALARERANEGARCRGRTHRSLSLFRGTWSVVPLFVTSGALGNRTEEEEKEPPHRSEALALSLLEPSWGTRDEPDE